MKSSGSVAGTYCSPEIFGDEPFTVHQATTSRTGKHGVAKTRLLVRTLYDRNETHVIVPSSEAFVPMHLHRYYQARTGIVMSVQANSLTVLDYETNATVHVQGSGREPGTQVRYYSWISPTRTAYGLIK